ncbi:MAG TPA: PepSY-associated TM helix domain-containing protein [Vicinamibacterales bacterium]|nr:PepSY-associated TM helix domain-containing protein [Vicinamibacterales bacterium]
MSVRAWQRVHTWTSVASTAFLLVSCLTGLPLIFHDEIDAILAPPVPSTPHAAAAAPLAVDDLVARARTARPGEHVQFVFWDDREPDVIGVGLAAAVDAPLEDVHRLMFDRWTGAVAVDRPPQNRWIDRLLDLHSTLFAGAAGEALLGLAGLSIVLAVISGVILYGPFMRRVDFGGIRADRSRRLAWLDLHNLVGITTAAWLVVVATTGFVNTLEAPLFAAWQGTEVDRLLAPYANQPALATPSSPRAAVDAARRALPGMTPTSEGFPPSRFATPRHYLIWMHGATPLTAHLFTPVLVDAATGQVASARGLPWYLRVLELSRPLHFGDYGWWPLKALWTVLDLATIAVLTTGLWLWAWRRRQHQRQPIEKLPSPRRQRGTDGPLWRMPIVLAVTIGVGLVSALLGDGIWDALSWLCLAAPIVIVARHLGRAATGASARSRTH